MLWIWSVTWRKLNVEQIQATGVCVNNRNEPTGQAFNLREHFSRYLSVVAVTKSCTVDALWKRRQCSTTQSMLLTLPVHPATSEILHNSAWTWTARDAELIDAGRKTCPDVAHWSLGWSPACASVAWLSPTTLSVSLKSHQYVAPHLHLYHSHSHVRHWGSLSSHSLYVYTCISYPLRSSHMFTANLSQICYKFFFKSGQNKKFRYRRLSQEDCATRYVNFNL